ncbi:MAG: hypothetical protein JSV86_13095 [Gemmatimonadota bacterium]|nr:MAG: hypothetical protein JSV86_13095 [Gemmatimonadota bacterium]
MSTTVINAAADWRGALASGRPLPTVDANTERATTNGLAAAYNRFGVKRSAPGRLTLDAMNRAFLHNVAQAAGKQMDVTSMRSDDVTKALKSLRNDASKFLPGATVAFQGELEEVLGDLIRQERRVRDMKSLFAVDSTLSPGKREYKIRALFTAGNARVFREGIDIPMQSVSTQEESRPIRHVVAGFEQTFFDAQAGAHMDVDEFREKANEAAEQIEDLLDALWWQGSEADDIWGFMSAPYINRREVSGITFDEGDGTAATFDAMKNALNEIANFPSLSQSGQVGMIRRCIVGPRQKAQMSQVMHPEMPLTLEQAFLNGQPLLDRVEVSPGFQGRGPGGTDVMWCSSDASSDPRLVQPQGLTTLPLMQGPFGLSQRQAMYASTGGVRFTRLLGSVMGLLTFDYGG